MSFGSSARPALWRLTARSPGSSSTKPASPWRRNGGRRWGTRRKRFRRGPRAARRSMSSSQSVKRCEVWSLRARSSPTAMSTSRRTRIGGRCVRRRAQARHQLRRGVEASAACGRIYRLLGQRQWRVRLVRDSWNARTTARKQRAACWLKPKSGRNRYRASIAPEPSCSDHAPPRSCGQLLLQAKKPRHGAWHPTASPTVRIARLGRREGVQDALRCQ